jgi:hypothetical protein
MGSKKTGQKARLLITRNSGHLASLSRCVMLNVFQHPSKPRSAAARLFYKRAFPRQTAL